NDRLRMERDISSLHRDYTGWQARRKLHDAVTVQAPAQNDPAGCIQPCDAAAVLAQLDPQYGYVHHSAPFPSGCPSLSAGREGRAIPTSSRNRRDEVPLD